MTAEYKYTSLIPDGNFILYINYLFVILLLNLLA